MARKTNEGKHHQQEEEKGRILNEKILKATLKEKNDLDDNEDDDSVEGDYPHIKLEDLLSELQIHDDKGEGDADEEEEKDEGEGEE